MIRRPQYIADKPTRAQLGFALREGMPELAAMECQLCRGADKNCDWCAGTGKIGAPKHVGA